MQEKAKFISENYLIIPIVIVSGVLNFWNLGIEGYGNIYYAAGIKSMLMNFKNFFFVSSDPSGFVSIDKPPLGFWIQAICAKIFGFSGWSIIFPQALSGVISVWVIYFLVKRSFGNIAGVIAALCLGVTPIFVAASRNNTIDNLLVLTLLLSCWALLIAAEKGKIIYLIISVIFIGIGFNIKMVEAYMVIPAIYITYLLSAEIPLRKKVKHLALSTCILLLVSLCWALTVDLIPAAKRPFIGSSTNNSVMELIIGHNGLERIGGDDGSKTGAFRLFSNNNISDQISWLLPFALLGFLAAAIRERLKFQLNNRKKISILLWFLWLAPELIYFSSTKSSFHTYYLTMMAPSIAALTGIGLTTMWKFYKGSTWKSWMLPITFIINGSTEMLILSYNYNKSNGYKTTTLATVIIYFIPSIILVILNLDKIRSEKNINEWNIRENYKVNENRILDKVLVAVGLLGILIAPIVWSFTPMFCKMNGSSPSAGLELFSSREEESIINDSKLIDFLKTNKANEKYLVAVPSAMNYASDLILKTGEPIMTIGGFSGSDKIISIDEFKQLVNGGELRYAIVKEGADSESFNFGNPNHPLTDWIEANGRRVDISEWQDASGSNSENLDINEGAQLYDLK